jgi:hypothetical protein
VTRALVLVSYVLFAVGFAASVFSASPAKSSGDAVATLVLSLGWPMWVGGWVADSMREQPLLLSSKGNKE